MVQVGLEDTAVLRMAVEALVAVKPPSLVGKVHIAAAAVAGNLVAAPCSRMVGNGVGNALVDVKEPWDKRVPDE